MSYSRRVTFRSALNLLSHKIIDRRLSQTFGCVNLSVMERILSALEITAET